MKIFAGAIIEMNIKKAYRNVKSGYAEFVELDDWEKEIVARWDKEVR